MQKLVDNFFKKEKIEYYATVAKESLRFTRSYLLEKRGIEPTLAILFLIPYYTVRGVNISSYAVSRDYHLYVRDVTDRLISELKIAYPDYEFYGFGDHSPIDERHAAASAGLGIFGDNGLLINEKYGSYVFIAEIFTNAPKELFDVKVTASPKRCDGCGACAFACPTGCLSGGVSCLSDITQKKGELSSEERELILKEGIAWGCDACQRVCPYNSALVETPLDFFRSETISKLSYQLVDSMGDEEFRSRAYSWRGKAVILRNLSLLEAKK